MKKLQRNPADLTVKYGNEPKQKSGWFYEEKNGIEIFADTEFKRNSNYLGKISKRKLLGIVSRIYQIDFKKYIK